MLMTTAVTAMVCGVEVISIMNTFSRGVILKSLSYTMNGVLKSISYVTEYDQPSVKEVVKELVNIDLEHKIKLIQILVTELEQLKEHFKSETIDFALQSLTEQMQLIQNDLNDIKDAIDNHGKKYFADWRCLSCGSMINSIAKKKAVLDSRYEELIGLLMLNDLLSAEKIIQVEDRTLITRTNSENLIKSENIKQISNYAASQNYVPKALKFW